MKLLLTQGKNPVATPCSSFKKKRKKKTWFLARVVGKRRENDVLLVWDHETYPPAMLQIILDSGWRGGMYYLDLQRLSIVSCCKSSTKVGAQRGGNLWQEWLSRDLMKLVWCWYHCHHQLNIMYIPRSHRVFISNCWGPKITKQIQTIGIWDRWIFVNPACFLEACNEAFKKPEVSNSPLYFVPWVSAVQVLPWRNWKHWDVDDAHLKRLDPWLQMQPDVTNTILLISDSI